MLQSLLHSHTQLEAREAVYVRVVIESADAMVSYLCLLTFLVSKALPASRQECIGNVQPSFSCSQDPFRNREVTCTKHLLHTLVSSLHDKLAESTTSKPDLTSFVGINNWTRLCMSQATCHAIKQPPYRAIHCATPSFSFSS